MNRHEKKLRGIIAAEKEHISAYKSIWELADKEEREPTPDERLEVEAHMKSINDLEKEKSEVEATLKTMKRADDLGREIGLNEPEEQAQQQTPAPQRIKSMGDQFIESKGYQQAKEKGFSGSWKTGHVELDVRGKATLVEGDNTFLDGGTPGEGASLVPLDRRPGVLPIMFERLTVADLMASASTSSNAIDYVVESVATNAAAIVGEGENKPESTLEYDHAQESVRKIATFLPVSDEMLSDAPAVRGYINSRLSFFVQQEEEEQLLHGAGGNNFLGLMPRVPASHKYVSSGAQSANAADHIYEALTVCRIDSFLEPDGIVIHPTDWAELRLLKDQNDLYIGGSPFSNTGSNPGDTLWGKRVVVTQAMIPGAALVGAFATASQVFRRGGLSVEASNSHADFFVQNLTAIRAEERLALAVYRPMAFALADLGYAS